MARLPWLDACRDVWRAEGTRLRGALADGALAGFATVRPSDGYVDQIAVDPRFWGRGVAEALIADARTIAPDGLHLLVNAMNGRAMGLYERMGFVRCEAGTNALSGLPTWRYTWRPGTERRGSEVG